MKKEEKTTAIFDEVDEKAEETVSQEQEEVEAEEEEIAEDEDSAATDDADEEAVEDDVPAEKPHKSNLGILIAEGIIAVAAIGFIGFAVGSSIGKKNKENNENVVSENVVSENTTSGQTANVPGVEEMPTIDNSALEEMRPAVTKADSLNKMTLAEADAEVSDGTMLKLTLATGENIYVPNYENPEVLASMVECDDDTVMEYINEQFLSQISEMQASDKTDCEEGDVVNIDYLGTLDGVAFDGGTDQGCNLELGSGRFIEGFEEGLIGHKVGDVVELPLTFPENYYEDLAGKDVVFTVSINCIMEEVYPELSDELVEEYFGETQDIHTSEECIAFFREQYILNELYAAFSEKVYESALNEENVLLYYDYNLDYYCYMYSMYYGMALTDIYGDEVSTLLDEIMATAADSSYNGAIFRAIAEKENLKVDDKDIEAMAKDFGYTSNEEFLANYDRAIIDDAVLIEKVLRHVNDNYYSKL
ncbi:MAG: FKBP-type peptidyl-prolyl cis-trans isomerase [Lachnospiraceae bacterium]|nr:FKBP-type peptidyl-prolyl cis-trans isomerase [Lachnospiraceae bacterium]